jgi:hypothetical protein
MAKTFFANGMEITYLKEIFCFAFIFRGPDGAVEKIYVSTTPSGAKTFISLTGASMEEYEKKYGAVQGWPKVKERETVNCLAT